MLKIAKQGFTNSQPGLFDDAHQVSAVRRALAPRTKVMTSAEQSAEKTLRYELLQNENWQREQSGTDYLFICTTKDKTVMPSTLEQLARKILKEDLGLDANKCSIDFGCHPRRGNAMMIRVSTPLLESKCDVMEEKLASIMATAHVATDIKGPAR